MISKKTIFLAIIISIIFPFSSIYYYVFCYSNLDISNEIYVIADDVPDVDLDELRQIDYDYLNYDWYNPKIEMLIIVPPNKPDFVKAVEPLAEWKNDKGVKTIILNDTTGFYGRDKAEKIRNMIKYYYERENIRWVLLAGDAQDDLIPIRKVYNPDVYRWEDAPLEIDGNQFYKATDYYYADLEGDWDSDGDGKWGEAPQDNAYGEDEIFWTPNVYVGRFPAKDANELETMVNKTLKYEINPEIGGWMHQMLLAGAISDTVDDEPPDGEDESLLTTYIIQHYTKLEMNYTHLAKWTFYEPPDPKEVLDDANFETRFNEGYSTVIFAGHGSYDSYVSKTDNSDMIVYTNNDAGNPSNLDELSLVYADACSTSTYDINNDSIGEKLIKAENAGAIGYIGGLRTNWYFTDDYNCDKLNRGNAKLFWQEFFQEKKFQQGRALYDSKISYINSDYIQNKPDAFSYDYERKQILTYSLLGDPEIDIYTNVPVNASNPFTGNIYEAQRVSTVIRNKNSEPVPYARVHLRTKDGKYYTAYADKNGFVTFRLPAQVGENYNITITGHNLIPSYFNFTTLQDIISPYFGDEEYSPENPTTSDNICFDVEAFDFQSGLESVFLLQTENDDFDEYEYYEMLNRFQDDDNIFTHELQKLKPGKYFFLIVGRDWANNYKILDDESIKITIDPPLMDYILILASIMVLSVAGTSVIIFYIGFKDYKHIFWKLKRESTL
ncbi:MAG: C25 family cysteine peptidase [Promethearchaeota archaeon]